MSLEEYGCNEAKPEPIKKQQPQFISNDDFDESELSDMKEIEDNEEVVRVPYQEPIWPTISKEMAIAIAKLHSAEQGVPDEEYDTPMNGHPEHINEIYAESLRRRNKKRPPFKP